MILSTIELIIKLEEITPEGLEVLLHIGVLTTTKAVYLKNELIYIFHMEYDWDFKTNEGFSKKEMLEKYPKTRWKVKQVID
ncbi:hypothetical protein [Lacihabitans lacunae]|uniref:Uncharacterized protein n=1 Tax=Lacihabitans lacunae TaxID=1028214 RepID=A0ABV7Z035_9BACT